MTFNLAKPLLPQMRAALAKAQQDGHEHCSISTDVLAQFIAELNDEYDDMRHWVAEAQHSLPY